LRTPWWQQATAVVSLGAGGVITGLSFVPQSPAELTSPAGLPVQLMALEQSAHQAPAADGQLRSAIVNVARHYLRLAQGRSPADMEALIWQHDSVGGADHGESCAAFASLTLELAARAHGLRSWVTGGTSYPWPVHKWADARVDPNPDSLGVISILQDAQAHHRWHPLGDGYAPQPGDWVLFDGHVEVVTGYSAGVLDTIGADSGPNLSVNAHSYADPLASQGVTGFVNNGALAGAAAHDRTARATEERVTTERAPRAATATGQASGGVSAFLPPQALPTPPAAHPGARPPRRPGPRAHRPGSRAHRTARPIAQGADVPGTGPLLTPRHRGRGRLGIPGLPARAHHRSGPAPYRRHHLSLAAPEPAPPTQEAFIKEVAAGAIATQRAYGVPASVTIAQAIDESGWGRSVLATRDNNLFGIKGSGPAGTDAQPTQEFIDGRLVSTSAAFSRYHSIAESIDAHGRLLATSGYFRQAMSDRHDPNAFAAALTGVYATDPAYGAKLIGLMQRYDLYRYDRGAAAVHQPPRGGAAIPGLYRAPHVPGRRPTRPAHHARPAAAPGAEPTPAPAQPTPAQPTPDQPGPAQPTPAHTAPAHSTPGQPGPAQPGPAQPGPAQPAVAQPGLTNPAPARPAAAQPTPVPTAPTSGRAPGDPIIPGLAGSGPGAQPGGRGGHPHLTPSAQPERTAPAAQARPGGATTPRAVHRARPAQPPAAAPRVPQPGAADARHAAPTRAAAAPGSASIPGPNVTVPAPLTETAQPLADSAPRPAATRQAPVAALQPQATSAQAPAATPQAPGATPQAPTGSGQPHSTTLQAQATGAELLADQTGPAAPSTAADGHLSIATEGARPRRYEQHLPSAVRTTFVGTAKMALVRAEPLYSDVANHHGIRWELLAACDWMQCKARAGYSPVHGEKLGAVNHDGSVYRTKSAALEQCAEDIVALARSVYQIDVTAPGQLSVRDLANVFAAFRWGRLLVVHRTSAMDFPYSVAGLTTYHMNMRWPNIDEPHAPDKPGSRFRMPFGAVPVVLGLSYPATA